MIQYLVVLHLIPLYTDILTTMIQYLVVALLFKSDELSVRTSDSKRQSVTVWIHTPHPEMG